MEFLRDDFGDMSYYAGSERAPRDENSEKLIAPCRSRLHLGESKGFNPSVSFL
jgi:hypothetical protein